MTTTRSFTLQSSYLLGKVLIPGSCALTRFLGEAWLFPVFAPANAVEEGVAREVVALVSGVWRGLGAGGCSAGMSFNRGDSEVSLRFTLLGEVTA